MMAQQLPLETKTNPIIQEMAKRKLSSKKLIPFCTYTDPNVARDYRARHLKLLAQKLELVEMGKIKRLMVFMPNRHWKSSLISQKFPAWFIGKRATNGKPHQVMLVSYGASLAEEHSTVSRDMVKDNKLFANVFPKVKIADNKQAVASWGIKHTEYGHDEPHPSFTAAGMLGGVTGKGADLLIMDDPVKNAAEAESPSIQERHWITWTRDLRTRLNPNAGVVLVMTRWSENDIAGQLLQKAKEDSEADQWEVLVLPALAYTSSEREEARRLGVPVPEEDPLGRKPGEALWDEKYSRQDHITTKANDKAGFMAIGQQMPRKPGGFLIGRKNFKILEALPQEGIIRWCLSSDWALTEKEQSPRGKSDPDYTVIGLVGLWFPDPRNPLNANIIIGGLRRKQCLVPDGQRMVKRFAQHVQPKINKKPYIVAGQDNVDKIALNGLSGDPEMIGWPIKTISRRHMRGDKVIKSEPWRSRAHMGRVYLLHESWLGEQWHEEFFLECEGFPKAAHDDQVDMVSVATVYLGLGKTKRKATSKQG